MLVVVPWLWQISEGKKSILVRAAIISYQLGLLFFINWFTDFFTENLGTEGKIKIKYLISILHFIKMLCNIL